MEVVKNAIVNFRVTRISKETRHKNVVPMVAPRN